MTSTQHTTPATPSQLGADEWVLSIFPTSTNGFFVDVGCGDGKHLSNTYYLETAKGWRGICIDPLARNFESRPRSVVEDSVVYGVDGHVMEFLVATDPNYSGLVEHLDTRHRTRVLDMEKERRMVKTVSLTTILDDYGAPSFIEYLSLDTEGSEYEILSTFDFGRYRFGAMTIQHNYDESKRWSIYNLLTRHGYVRVKEVRWEDWYVHQSVPHARAAG